MKNWDITDETGICSSDKDITDFFHSCSHLGIRHKEVNFVKDYWHQVFRLAPISNTITVLCVLGYILLTIRYDYANSKRSCK